VIVRIRGGESGLKEYLEAGQKKGRELHRDQLDQRIPLFGDLNVFEIATASHEGAGRRYDHITLSFPEHHVSDEMLQKAVDEFRDHALAAWPEDQRHRVAFYAEAHRPKVLSYENAETGEHVVRLTHIHVAIGRRDLATGKAIEALGYLGPESDNLKYIDAWQESFNSRHGFASPKDNPKITPENAVDTLARYNGARPDSLGSFNQRKFALEIALQKEILTKNITTWADFGKLLEGYGTVSTMHKGKFNECYRVKPHESPKAMRLSGIFFQREFIERPTSEKHSIIFRKAKAAYLEQMQPRKAPEYLDAILNEWRITKAREHRYLHTGSKYYKEVYKPADAATRLLLLDQLERKQHAKPRRVQNIGFKEITPTRTCVPGMPIRDMDGIQNRTEMLLFSHDDLELRALHGGEQNSVVLRQADQRRNGSILGRVVNQPSNVITRVIADQRERYAQASDKDRFSEIRKNLDCTQLLNHLSHSHGLNLQLYQVTAAKDGTQRIHCGSRSLTPNDFLTKELGLSWKEAAPILRKVYEQQIKSKITQPRQSKPIPLRLWQDYKAERNSSGTELSKRLAAFNALAKARRLAMSSAFKDEQKAALAGLTGPERKAALSLEKLRLATAKAELSAVIKEERQQLRDSIQPSHAKAWRIFLQRCSQAGDGEALSTLRKLDDKARNIIHATASFTGTINLEEEDSRNLRRILALAILRSLTHVVESNGDVLYSQNGREILRDEGRHLAVLDELNEEVILAGLLIAHEKFIGPLSLTGCMDFQRRAVAVAVDHGVQVRFVDPSLEELRLRLVKEKRQGIQVVRSAAVAPIAAEKLKTDQVQKTPDEIQPNVVAIEPVATLTAYEKAQAWTEEYAKANSKTLLDPKPGTGDVIFVEQDFVVVNKGRSISVYSNDNSLDLQVGSKVVIGKNMQILLQQKTLEVKKER
jgi:hypothetical protein